MMQDVVFVARLARSCGAVMFSRAMARKVSPCHSKKQWQSFLVFVSCVTEYLYSQGLADCYAIANDYRRQATNALAGFTRVGKALWQVRRNGKTYLPVLKRGI